MTTNWLQLLNTTRLRTSERISENDPRTEFESDYGRVIFSPAIRRMHDKTQVIPLTTDDNIHSRLTHSIEVMGVGYSLGLKLLENSDFIIRTGISESELYRQIPLILQSSCLVHDIGNPPFGHFGEKVFQQYFERKFAEQEFKLTNIEKEDFVFFDGNAQGFRVLTKVQSLNDTYGLNLTYATLGSYIKYPNADDINTNLLSHKKRGVFQTERVFLDKIMKSCNLVNSSGRYFRHPLAFLMEAADSICYLVMDIEDGYNKHWYTYEFIREKLIKIEGVDDIFLHIEKTYTGYGQEIARMVNLRIGLIRKLVQIATDNFLNNLDEILIGNYDFELIKDKTNLAGSLEEFCKQNILNRKEIYSLELTGHSVIKGLLDYYINFLFDNSNDYIKRAEGMISASVIRTAFLESGLNEKNHLNELSDYFKLRVIVDFISGMTDQFALNHYQKLSGQKLN